MQCGTPPESDLIPTLEGPSRRRRHTPAQSYPTTLLASPASKDATSSLRGPGLRGQDPSCLDLRLAQSSPALTCDWSAQIRLPFLLGISASGSIRRFGCNDDRRHPALRVIKGTRGWTIEPDGVGGGLGNRILPLQDATDERRGGA